MIHMRLLVSRQWLGILLISLTALTTFGCARTQSLTKAPVTKLLVGGDEKDRRQEYALKHVKWSHMGKHGKILGARYFTDSRLPISGARAKDTFSINTAGLYKRDYTIDSVIRIRTQKRRLVILKVTSDFPVQWKAVHEGTGGLVTTHKIGERTVLVFTDKDVFPPDVPLGTRLVLRTSPTPLVFTIQGFATTHFT